MSLIGKLERSPRGGIARMLKMLAAEMKLARDVLHGIEVRGDEIHLHWRHKPKPGAEAVLAIDADANEAIGRRVWGNDLRHVSLPVRRNAFVTQVNEKFAACRREQGRPASRGPEGGQAALLDRRAGCGARRREGAGGRQQAGALPAHRRRPRRPAPCCRHVWRRPPRPLRRHPRHRGRTAPAW